MKRKYKKMTDEGTLAKFMHKRLAKETPWTNWDGPMPDVARLVWLDTAKLVLQLAKQKRI